MELNEIIKLEGELIEVEGKLIKYLEIMDLGDLGLKYGISNKGWVVFYDNKEKIIQSNNYITLLKLVELPIQELINNIRKNHLFENFKIEDFKKLVPILDILKTSIKMESDYWSVLSIEILL